MRTRLAIAGMGTIGAAVARAVASDLDKCRRDVLPTALFVRP